MLLQTLVSEFLFECEIRQYSPMTVKNYQKQLKHFLQFLSSEFQIEKLEELEPKHVKSFIRYYQMRQCKPSYVNDNLKAVKVLFSYAQKEKYVDYLITENIKNVKEPKTLIHPFSDNEIKKMISYYNGHSYVEIRNKLMLMILFDTGIRINELLTMKPDQIQSSYFIIYGKGNKGKSLLNYDFSCDIMELRHKVNIVPMKVCVFTSVKMQALFWHTFLGTNTLCRSNGSYAFL